MQFSSNERTPETHASDAMRAGRTQKNNCPTCGRQSPKDYTAKATLPRMNTPPWKHATTFVANE
jgi:hypothetical protein